MHAEDLLFCPICCLLHNKKKKKYIKVLVISCKWNEMGKKPRGWMLLQGTVTHDMLRRSHLWQSCWSFWTCLVICWHLTTSVCMEKRFRCGLKMLQMTDDTNGWVETKIITAGVGLKTNPAHSSNLLSLAGKITREQNIILCWMFCKTLVLNYITFVWNPTWHQSTICTIDI